MIEALLLTTSPVKTFNQNNLLTNASGFFFSRDNKLFLVTSRHVLVDTPSSHFPDRIDIEIHNDPANLATSTQVSIPLYQSGEALFRQGKDHSGEVDVAVIEIDQQLLPASAVFASFSTDHLLTQDDNVDIGTPILIVGFPLGFHDTLHHLPIVRDAINASSFSLRFQGQGYFLTDGRTHRGMSGAPVVTRSNSHGLNNNLPWRLLGIHSARFDVGTRDMQVDEALGLNCAWFADILLPLTS